MTSLIYEEVTVSRELRHLETPELPVPLPFPGKPALGAGTPQCQSRLLARLSLLRLCTSPPLTVMAQRGRDALPAVRGLS